MRFHLRLLVALLLVIGASLTPVTVSHHGTAPVLADNDKGKNGNDQGEDEHGDKGKDHKKDKKDKKDDKAPVGVSDGYSVEVSCEAGDDTTICQFTPQAPEGAKKVNHLLVPASVACADVVESDADYVDPDPNIHRTGFRATRKEGASITFAGEVTTSGVATYWVKAASGVYPAQGPGLDCGTGTAAAAPGVAAPPTGEPATPQPTTESTPVATLPATSGTILVTTFTCNGVTADSPDVDWFGTCQPAGAGHTFAVTGGSTELSQTSGDDGTTTFTNLTPASYSLDDTSADWCHAESDSVDSSGQLVIEAGATATVWLFYCP